MQNLGVNEIRKTNIKSRFLWEKYNNKKQGESCGSSGWHERDTGFMSQEIQQKNIVTVF